MKKTPLRKVSRKRAKELRAYFRIRQKLLSNGAFCEFPDCVSRANQIHHIKGRSGKLLTDRKYLMIVCIEHHNWIHENGREARGKGLLQ